MNPWDRTLDLILLKQFSVGTVSVWFLVPNETNQNFEILASAYPELSGDVEEELNRLTQEHHPCFYNEQEFKSLMDQYKKSGGRDWRKEFIRCWERKKVVSLTGWVFRRGRVAFSKDKIPSRLAISAYPTNSSISFPAECSLCINAFIIILPDRRKPARGKLIITDANAPPITIIAELGLIKTLASEPAPEKMA